MQLNPHRKWPNVSIIGIKERWSVANWNNFLRKCYKFSDVTSLKKMLYGIQADMSDLRKEGVDDASIVNLFLRLQKSLEDTAKKLFRKIYPSPIDDPKANIDIKKRLVIKEGGDITSVMRAKKDFELGAIAKKKRDLEFEKFIKDSRF